MGAVSPQAAREAVSLGEPCHRWQQTARGHDAWLPSWPGVRRGWLLENLLARSGAL